MAIGLRYPGSKNGIGPGDATIPFHGAKLGTSVWARFP